MTSREISNARLRSQKVEATEFNTAREIVSWMGAIQAQDYSMSFLSVTKTGAVHFH
jgi:predicted DNA-binding protein with PD1-like motif